MAINKYSLSSSKTTTLQLNEGFTVLGVCNGPAIIVDEDKTYDVAATFVVCDVGDMVPYGKFIGLVGETAVYENPI